MRGKPKLYVDANLRVVPDLFARKAIVNMVNGCIEVTFLKPIAYHKNLSDAWKARGEWQRMYFKHYSANLPRAESCLFANIGEKDLLFKSCYTSSDHTDYHGRRDYWYMIDECGQKVASKGEILENVYVSVLLKQEEFFSINPNVDLSRYSISQCF